jgi:quinol monooxygenase YgiN
VAVATRWVVEVAEGEDQDTAQEQADPEVTVVTMQFDAADADRLQAVLAKYVVLTRGHPGCRNVDLCRSALAAERFVIIEKWTSPAAQRKHFDSADMVEMAEACGGLLERPPQIDLLDSISAHDLR